MLSLEHWMLSLTFLSSFQESASAFSPHAYESSTARCQAIRRGADEVVVDIDMKYVNINPAKSTSLIMVHGWPSVWSSWSKQIEEFEKDHHLIVPDLRGFGQSGHPGKPRTSGTIPDIIGDLVCILEHAKVSSAICMGHDWGSAVCYEAARRRPDIFVGVIGAVVPYLPADGPFMPTRLMGSMIETLNYQTFFDAQPDKAAKELMKDIRRTMRATLRTVASHPPKGFLTSNETFLGAWDSVSEIPPVPFFSQEEEDYFTSQFDLHDFRNTLQFYSNENRFLGWESSHNQGNHTIPQPCLVVYPTQDPVADWEKAADIMRSDKYLPRLTTKTMPGAHWMHLEHPQIFNRIVRDWLNKL